MRNIPIIVLILVIVITPLPAKTLDDCVDKPSCASPSYICHNNTECSNLTHIRGECINNTCVCDNRYAGARCEYDRFELSAVKLKKYDDGMDKALRYILRNETADKIEYNIGLVGPVIAIGGAIVVIIGACMASNNVSYQEETLAQKLFMATSCSVVMIIAITLLGISSCISVDLIKELNNGTLLDGRGCCLLR